MLTTYHGSTSRVEQPLAGVCRPNLDFGVGFYLTDLKEQASRWALRTADIRHETNVWLNVYSLDMEACRNTPYHYLHFTTYDAHWLDFVVSCRQGGSMWKDYDIIESGIADIVMQGKYYGIVKQLATRLHISDIQALGIFYNSIS